LADEFQNKRNQPVARLLESDIEMRELSQTRVILSGSQNQLLFTTIQLSSFERSPFTMVYKVRSSHRPAPRKTDGLSRELGCWNQQIDLRSGRR
jgi:hypothetical protein